MIIEQRQSFVSQKTLTPQTTLLQFSQIAETMRANNQATRSSVLTKVPFLHDTTRDLGYFLYEILAITDLMREAYVNKDMESLQNRLGLLKAKTSSFAKTLSALVDSKTPAPATDPLELCIFDIDALLQEILEKTQLLVRDKPVKVTYISSPCPLLVFSNRFTIKEIIMELCTNAAQYTNHGRIAVILNKDKNRIRFTVTDTGIGMTPDEITTLLAHSEPSTMNQDVQHSETLHPGITMVLQYLKTLNGTIVISSKFREGTIVEVELPIEYTDHSSTQKYR